MLKGYKKAVFCVEKGDNLKGFDLLPKQKMKRFGSVFGKSRPNTQIIPIISIQALLPKIK